MSGSRGVAIALIVVFLCCLGGWFAFRARDEAAPKAVEADLNAPAESGVDDEAATPPIEGTPTVPATNPPAMVARVPQELMKLTSDLMGMSSALYGADIAAARPGAESFDDGFGGAGGGDTIQRLYESERFHLAETYFIHQGRFDGAMVAVSTLDNLDDAVRYAEYLIGENERDCDCVRVGTRSRDDAGQYPDLSITWDCGEYQNAMTLMSSTGNRRFKEDYGMYVSRVKSGVPVEQTYQPLDISPVSDAKPLLDAWGIRVNLEFP